MPYLNKHHYLETDLQAYEDYDITSILDQVAYHYREFHRPEMPDIQPPLAEGLALAQELSRASFQHRYYGAKVGQARQLPQLRKEVLQLARTWGDYMMARVSAGQVKYYFTGFPWLDLQYDLRRPRTSASFVVKKNRETGTYRWSCQMHVKPLTYFHWEASEDGTNRLPLGTSRRPNGSTRKLDPARPYAFRMYASNPKGKSHYSYYLGGLAV